MDKRMAADAALEGVVSYQVWLERFQAEWNEPDRLLQEAAAEEQTLAAWYSVPPQQMEMMEAADPKGFATAQRMVKEIEEKRKPLTQSGLSSY